MFIIAFIGGFILTALWLSQHLPPWYVWLGFVLAIIGIIGFSFMPYYKRVRDRVTIKAKNISYIESFIYEGSEFLNELKNSLVLTDHERNMLVQWRNDVGEYLGKNIIDEYVLWNCEMWVNFYNADLLECTKAVEHGIAKLKTIHEFLRNQVLIR